MLNFPGLGCAQAKTLSRWSVQRFCPFAGFDTAAVGKLALQDSDSPFFTILNPQACSTVRQRCSQWFYSTRFSIFDFQFCSVLASKLPYCSPVEKYPVPYMSNRYSPKILPWWSPSDFPKSEVCLQSWVASRHRGHVTTNVHWRILDFLLRLEPKTCVPVLPLHNVHVF